MRPPWFTAAWSEVWVYDGSSIFDVVDKLGDLERRISTLETSASALNVEFELE